MYAKIVLHDYLIAVLFITYILTLLHLLWIFSKNQEDMSKTKSIALENILYIIMLLV